MHKLLPLKWKFWKRKLSEMFSVTAAFSKSSLAKSDEISIEFNSDAYDKFCCSA